MGAISLCEFQNVFFDFGFIDQCVHLFSWFGVSISYSSQNPKDPMVFSFRMSWSRLQTAPTNSETESTTKDFYF
jgi:hypothetical protein